MLFEGSITILKSTTQTSPKRVKLKIAKGIIAKIMVRPRPGHAGLAHLVIRFHEQQIAPSTELMDFSGDTFPIDWEEYFKVYEPPFELVLEGWNDDDTYSHTFDVFVSILPREAVVALAVTDVIQKVLNVVRDMIGMMIPRRITGGGS